MPKQKKKEEQTEDTQEVQDQEQSDLQKFVATALRQPRCGIYEQLLSQFLAQAVIVTDPLKRIKVVCEAALMIPEKDRENLAIDYEKIEAMHAVTNAMLNFSIRKTDPSYNVELVAIPWGFSLTEENFQKYIEPWFTCNVSYEPWFLRSHVKWKFVKKWPRDEWKIEEIIKEPFWDFFFDVSSCLHLAGCQSMRNAFAAWAIPQVQLYLAELTQVVNPSVYAEVLGLYTRGSKGSYADKVKEATKPTEASSSEA